MRVIDWNISWGCKPDAIASLLKASMEADSIAMLQEVTPATYSLLSRVLGNEYSIAYSLVLRNPGPYDGKNRQLGVAIICSKRTSLSHPRLVERALFPERTLIAEVGNLRVMTFHSITGCDYRKAKSAQFLSISEFIDREQPDIVGFDANEPKVDHYEIDKMVYYDNRDMGLGARTLFQRLCKNGHTDAFTTGYNTGSFTWGQPIAVSHKVGGDKPKRYDFLFVKQSLFRIVSCQYLYEEATQATSDHAMIMAEILHID